MRFTSTSDPFEGLDEAYYQHHLRRMRRSQKAKSRGRTKSIALGPLIISVPRAGRFERARTKARARRRRARHLQSR